MESLLCGFTLTFLLNMFSSKFDILGNLPLELGTHILRMLDGRNLMAAALVSERWCDLCYTDPVLKRRIRDYLRETRAKREVKENCTPNCDYYTYSNAPSRAPPTTVSKVAKLVSRKFAGKRKRQTNRQESTSHKRAKTLRL